LEIVTVQVFVSLALVLGSLILFGISAKQRDYEHADRLALLPIEKDAGSEEAGASSEKEASMPIQETS